jgi:TrfA protein
MAPIVSKSADEHAAEKQAQQLVATIGVSPRQHAPEPPLRSQPAKVYQLPLWPEPVRGAPNSFLRSALFAAIQGKGRKQMQKELLASLQGVTVRFTGQQLDQSDLDVWEQAIHLARRHPLGNVCHFTAYAFLQALGRNNGNTQYQWLDDAITRLVACAVHIETAGKKFTGSLLSSCLKDEVTGIYKLTLDPATMQLYGWNDWTAIDRNRRDSLRGKPYGSTVSIPPMRHPFRSRLKPCAS